MSVVTLQRQEDIQGPDAYVSGPPELAVEVLSPSTRRFDLGMKKDLYAESGVENYWIIDPEQVTLTAFHLGDEGYEQVAMVKDKESVTLTEPFAVTITPATLVTRPGVAGG